MICQNLIFTWAHNLSFNLEAGGVPSSADEVAREVAESAEREGGESARRGARREGDGMGDTLVVHLHQNHDFYHVIYGGDTLW